MTKIIDLNGICVNRGSRPIVHKLSASVEQDSWFGVIGANGSGKTTALRAIAGRLPIASGQCLINDEDMTADRSARAKAIGFAPPIERLPNLLTIGDLLELAGEDIDEQKRRNHDLWAALGISDLLTRTIGQSSSGMRQRASIALAFALPTSIVILDEPFNWLDPVAAFDTRAALAKKVRAGITLITALHDLPTLCSVCERGIMMAGGRVTLDLGRDQLRAGMKDIHSFERDMIEALRTL